ncbi:hypothetical protein KSS87_021644 [Heliosperma pusillum]|nr:hypothetical protein KSS87_021644 [Heliosperma pusillum]
MKEDSHKDLQCKQMGNEARKTHCSHKELQMQTMGNEVRLTQGLTM